MRIELRCTKLKIWRRIDVPLSSSLMSLHERSSKPHSDGWLGHLIEFTFVGRSFSEPTKGGSSAWDCWGLDVARNISLKAIVDAGIRKFDCPYDFGDNSEHLITIRASNTGIPGSSTPDWSPVRGAPEDIGGVWMFYNFLEAPRNPDHPDRDRYEEWPRKDAMEAFDPDDVAEESTRDWIASVGQTRR
ncbi:MAG: plasmid pRiA4b ORF-3 family protein [Bryobacterales bacterium]|nr:plasmid pRiA4b ORF-3 family protein [Bryobacterales bacterium]